MDLKEAKQILKANGYILEEGIVDKVKARFSKTPNIAKMDLKADDNYDSSGNKYDPEVKAWYDKVRSAVEKDGFTIKDDNRIYNKHNIIVGIIYISAKKNTAELEWLDDIDDHHSNHVAIFGKMSAEETIAAWRRDSSYILNQRKYGDR